MPGHDDLDCVAFISIRLHSNGSCAISGNIGDTKLALQMIDAARDAVKHQHARRNEIIIPNRDVEADQDHAFPTIPRGDMRQEDRGDAP